MITAAVLAAEHGRETLWYPTIVGVLAVVAGIALFCGSVYVLLATNLGARLGFLVAFTGLMGFMVLLTTLWITTASPLNTLRGGVPAWEARQVVGDLSRAKDPEIRHIDDNGRKVNATEASNVKAAVDDALVTKVDTAVETFPPEANKFARFAEVDEYLVVNTYEIGGSKPNPLEFEFTHEPLFAVAEFCGAEPSDLPFGVAPPEPECAAPGTPEAADNGFIILERDLGSLRLPPLVAFIMSCILFGLGLLCLHWRERDERATRRQVEDTPRAPVPAKV